MKVPKNGPVVSTISSDELDLLFEKAVDEEWIELTLLGPRFSSEDIARLRDSYLKSTNRIFHCLDARATITAAALATLNNLTSLNLAGNSIGHEGAAALATLSNLTSLNLRHNSIGDEGAAALATLSNLTSLNLEYNSIGHEGAAALATLSNLTSLDLAGNSIGA